MKQNEIDSLLDESRTLIDAMFQASDSTRKATLEKWAIELLIPLVEQNIPKAKWLYKSTLYASENGLSFEAYESLYWKYIKEAAAGGCEDAQFAVACELDEDTATKGEAARIFKQLAEKGHAHAQWRHGLNLISGIGGTTDEARGIDYVKQSADGSFEGAIEFLAEAYAAGNFGFERDDALAAQWWKKKLYAENK
jgi:TPR repeat protein